LLRLLTGLDKFSNFPETTSSWPAAPLQKIRSCWNGFLIYLSVLSRFSYVKRRRPA